MAHWFKHDSTSLTDQKILGLRFKFGMEGYGIFWAIMETMHQDPTGYINREAIGGLSIAYGVDNTKLNELVDFCLKIGLLLECEHGNIYNKRMQIQKSELADYSSQGRKGAEIRWKNRGAIGGAIGGGNAGANADQIKIKNNKEYSDEFESFWKAYPKKVGKGSSWVEWKKELPKLDSCLKALSWQIKSESWTKENGKYIVDPERWIKKRRWEDEPQKVNKPVVAEMFDAPPEDEDE